MKPDSGLPGHGSIGPGAARRAVTGKAMKRNRQELLAFGPGVAHLQHCSRGTGLDGGYPTRRKARKVSRTGHVPKISCSSMGSSASELSDTDLLSKPSKVSWRTFSQWGGRGKKVVRSSSGRRWPCFCRLRVGSSDRLRMVGLAFWSSAMAADVETDSCREKPNCRVCLCLMSLMFLWEWSRAGAVDEALVAG